MLLLQLLEQLSKLHLTEQPTELQIIESQGSVRTVPSQFTTLVIEQYSISYTVTKLHTKMTDEEK